MLENKQMLVQMLDEPTRFLLNIRRYSNALKTSMVFGWRTPTYEDEKMKQLFDGFSEFAAINQTGTAALIDFFPVLRWLPDFLLPAQKRAKGLFAVEKKLYTGHWLNAKNCIKEGTPRPCFCVDMARQQDKEGFNDDQAGYISGTLLEAGSDTTSSTLHAFIQTMLCFPDVQKKAQEEIDRVVGKDRLLTMDDEPNLQYIRGCIKETLRWMPTTILGAVPHAGTQDHYYEGYLIPKGAGVLNNVYTIHMDENRHPDPRRSDPMRYKDDFQNSSDSAASPDGMKRDHFTFGVGRRICPGMRVAERSLFLGMSRMLWGFDITPTTGPNGEPVIPNTNLYSQGFVCMPEEFAAVITPRSKERADIVRREWEEAERELLDPKTKQWREVPVGMSVSKA
jgi:cytochrome P450